MLTALELVQRRDHLSERGIVTGHENLGEIGYCFSVLSLVFKTAKVILQT